jgi:putative peptide zinc metalloprotease protein
MTIAANPSQAAMTPSNRRPIPLQARPDLKIERIDYQGVAYWVVKEPVGLKYYRLQTEQYEVLFLLDGKRSLEEIRDELLRILPTVRLQLSDIQHLITDLHEKGLVYSNRMGQGAALLKQKRDNFKKKVAQTFKSLLYLRLPGWDPERTLQILEPIAGWLFKPWGLILMGMFILSSWVMLALRFNDFMAQIPEFQQFFGWPNLMYLWLTLAVCKILHEFGHGLSCKVYGGECHEMGVMLLCFSPCLYCDVSDSWTLKNKWKRIMIGAAGMYIEVIISGIAIYLWAYTQTGLMHHLCLNIFFVTTITTVIFNANPLMRFDGYFMLADLLEIPNLRPKADKLLRESFAWYCLGIEAKPDPFMPETGKFWFVVFAISANIYRIFVMIAILTFFYTVLKPYGLQSIGITMAVVSFSGIIYSMVSNLYKTITAPRIEPMSRPKIIASCTILTILLGVALGIPIPWHFDAMFIVEPHDVEHVYVTTPGFLRRQFVSEGARVQAGDLIAQLENPDKEDKKREMEVQGRVITSDIRVHQANDELAELEIARQKLTTVKEQLDEYESQLAQLRIVAPCSGTVIAPPIIPEPKAEETRIQLTTWHGTPLQSRNLHCFLEERTHICSIAPDDKFQATLLVDQQDRNDIQIGDEVQLKFDHLPDKIYIGKVEKISDRHLEFVPQLLSNKLGGEVPTKTDEQGRERLVSAAYQTTVVLPEDASLLRSGMRGRARFHIGKRSAWDWIWRYIKTTFHFRL